MEKQERVAILKEARQLVEDGCTFKEFANFVRPYENADDLTACGVPLLCRDLRCYIDCPVATKSNYTCIFNLADDPTYADLKVRNHIKFDKRKGRK